MVCVFRDIVKDRPKIRHHPKIFLRSFENVAHRDKYVIVNLMCLMHKGRLQERHSNLTQLNATQDLSVHSTSFHCKKILCCQVESTY